MGVGWFSGMKLHVPGFSESLLEPRLAMVAPALVAGALAPALRSGLAWMERRAEGVFVARLAWAVLFHMLVLVAVMASLRIGLTRALVPCLLASSLTLATATFVHELVAAAPAVTVVLLGMMSGGGTGQEPTFIDAALMQGTQDVHVVAVAVLGLVSSLAYPAGAALDLPGRFETSRAGG